MRHKHTSYAFLTEMVCICALFLICASIFVTAFAKAESLSRQADLLNQAVQAAENAMEETFAAQEAADEAQFSTDDFTVLIDTELESDLMNVTIHVIKNTDSSTLYTLTGSRALSEGSDA